MSNLFELLLGGGSLLSSLAESAAQQLKEQVSLHLIGLASTRRGGVGESKKSGLSNEGGMKERKRN